MRSTLLAFSFASSCLLMSGAAGHRVPQGPPVPGYQWMKDRLHEEASLPAKRDAGSDQARLMDPPNIALPPNNDDGDDGNEREHQPPAEGGLTISDVLPASRRINIFSGFTRDIGTVSNRLEDGNQNSTILAPDNTVMMKLPRKPWEDPKDYEQLGANAYAGGEGEDRAHRNLRRFVEAHVVPSSPWKEGEKVETLAGGTVWWEQRDGKKFVSVD
jgi:hypothetical protein